MKPEVVFLPDAVSLFRRAADEFVAAQKTAFQERGTFFVVLAGGSTPAGLYALLAKEPGLPWESTHFFWGDERHVPPENSQSNYRMAREALLSHIGVPPGHVHRIHGELHDPEEAARLYRQEIRSVPCFDLVLLGMGPDGHTASLFPGTRAVEENQLPVVSNWVGKFNSYRITMTAGALNQSRKVMFLVSGEDKAPALAAVLEGPHEPAQLPAQLICPQNGGLLWLVDQKAGSLLARV